MNYIPTMSPQQALSFGDRLVRRDSHLVWKGATKRTCTGNLVGVVQINKKRAYVHRIVWELYIGSSHGIALSRTCEMPMCVEPQHMEIRSRSKGKQSG